MKLREITLTCGVALALVAGLGAVAAAESAEHGHQAEHIMITPDQIEWSAVGSLPPGSEAAVLEGNPSEPGEFTMRIRFPANYDIPPHTHPAVERVTVLKGTFYFAEGETFDREKAKPLPPGSLAVMPTGVPMYAFTGDEPSVVQLNGIGPWGITYVNPEDDPRQASE